ncbi:hypothetical protein [Megalodesulfovibrio paquesii]
MAVIAWGARLLLLAVALFAVGLGVFNGAAYPPHGLDGFKEADYNKAILKVAALYAVSVNMSLGGLEESEYHSLGNGKTSFAWGIVTLQDREGMEYRLWVSLQYTGVAWTRASSNVYPDNKSLGLLVDPFNRMFFLKNTQPNKVKTSAELDLMLREQLRRFREYAGTSQ